MTTMTRKELNNNELEMVNGGGFWAPGDYVLEYLGLDGLVDYTGGWWSSYYDTYRGNGVWKNVGTEDMLRYVERTIGSNDPRYKALMEYVENGMVEYNGKFIC